MLGSILIIARNNLALTKTAVKSALGQVDQNTDDMGCTVLVIDNASSDGTTEWLRTKGKILAIGLTEQRSLAYCWNWGLKSLWALSKEPVLVLNNDVEIHPQMYSWLRMLGMPFLTGVGVDDKSQMKPYPLYANDDTPNPHPDFSAFMIRKSVVDKVGWFNEEYYPAYAEDCDYHIRMHKAGINAYSIDFPFYHESSSTMKHCSPQEKFSIEKGAEANRERFKAQYGCYPGSEEYQKLFV